MLLTRKLGATLLAWCLPMLLFAQSKKPSLRISHLTGNCYVFTSWNMYRSEPVPANGLYVLTPKGAVLLDSPWDTTECKPLLDSIYARHHQKVVLCIATHSHGDRTGGFGILQREGIATWSSQETYDTCVVHHEHTAAYRFLKDTTFNIGGCRIQTYYPGPGHTADNIVLWLPQNKVLYGGCFVKCTEDTGLGYIAEANLEAWPASIRNVQKRFPHPAYVIPGHGSWENIASLDHTFQLLKERKK
ncbi:subclass B1 metallo-beta-lactamase [Chitinophaga vietnamensis]|uniref:subclass B1 metallo-beta-lactamase n=1 Tax=Chitinophaga vietnamensis TaxID=2593957 RepID=UPI001177FCB8|nr:subclass B1 metallo-beta-lactamase [Chitinophaga vietnamensis]